MTAPVADLAPPRRSFFDRLRAFVLTGHNDPLPKRVRRAIALQEERAERAIGWAQLSIVLLFGALYFLAPSTSIPNAPVEPVPMVLTLYLILTVIRIVWSYRMRLPGWSLALSSIYDIGLLMALIWLFHVQYGQPPSFYLKAPTLLYVFIFISLRALRFDARFVLWTGLVAALGWGAMVLYVISSNPANNMITRDYITYMTDNAILLGAEFDKIISILVVTIILAASLWRGRALLVRSVEEGMAAAELKRFFAPEIAAQIAGSDGGVTPGEGAMREAAVVVLDLRGFTDVVSGSRPEDVMALLNDYQQWVVPIVQRHGGSIDKFLGDGVLATFGAAAPSETAAADAVRALEHLLEEGARWDATRRARDQLSARVNGALATGQILFGAVGDESRLEITVIGEAVNVSSKIEKHNKVLGSAGVVTQAALERARAQGYDGPLLNAEVSAAQVDGVAQPVNVLAIHVAAGLPEATSEEMRASGGDI